MLTCILYAALGLVVAVYARDPCDHVDNLSAGDDIMHTC